MKGNNYVHYFFIMTSFILIKDVNIYRNMLYKGCFEYFILFRSHLLGKEKKIHFMYFLDSLPGTHKSSLYKGYLLCILLK